MIWRGVLEPAIAAEPAHQIAASPVEIGLIDRKIRGAPGLDACRDGAMALVKEWPVEEALIRHQNIFCLRMILSENRYPLFGIMR